ncbi:MAG TPA: MoxR family ATPase [Methylomirabilota bacterium]|nr:MoxR family ATPase [Methylomirabilota bacterium]
MQSESVPPPVAPPITEEELVRQLAQARTLIDKELSKVIVGQKDVIDQILVALLSGGHCLITGAPGLAKTLLVKTVARVFHLDFQRVQFTPDLMPADITGTELLTETEHGRRLTFVKGPVFANIVLADEINRTPPKTQSALLEAMQEHQVTAAGSRYALPQPFFVLATQNPIEMEGTYPLPEAQLDRFMFNVFVDYLPMEEEIAVVMQTSSTQTSEPQAIFTAETVLNFHKLIRQVPIGQDVVRYAVQLVSATRPKQPGAPEFVNNLVNWGAGIRASQFLVIAAKTKALLEGRAHVTFDDVKSFALPILRHRVLLNYRAEAEGVTVNNLVDRILETVKPVVSAPRK